MPRIAAALLSFYVGQVAFAGQPLQSPGGEGRGPAHSGREQVGKEFVPETAPQLAPRGLERLLDAATDKRDQPLAVDDLLGIACQNNPTLQQAQMQVNGTLGKAIQAGLWPNPVVTYVGEQITLDRMGSTTPGEFQGAIIQQEIVTADKRKLSRQKYLQRARTAEFLAVAQQWRVCNDVRIHFWRTLGQHEIVGIRRELLKTAEDVSVTARELWNLGQATRAELHRADIILQQGRLELLRADNRYQREFAKLSSLVGLELTPQPLAGKLEPTGELIDFETVLCQLYEESPEIQAAWAKFRADQITVERERVEPIPNLVVRGGMGYNFVDRETVGVAQLAIEVPLWDRNQGTIQQAESDLVRQEGEIRRTQLMLRLQLAERYEAYLTALQHAQEFQTVVLPKARAAYQQQLEAYKQNRQNWSDVLGEQRNYFDLRHQYIEHLIELRTNEVLIRGYMLHGGLMAPPNPTPPGHIDAVPQPR